MRVSPGLFLWIVAPVLAAETASSIPVFFIQDSPSRFVAESPEMRATFTPRGATFQIGDDRVGVRFTGGNANVEMGGRFQMGGANLLIGSDPNAWRTELSTFKQIFYRRLYLGIDVIYAGADSQVKSEFHVAPGTDPRQIHLEYTRDLSIDADGSLQAGFLREKKPRIYQNTTAGRVNVDGRYRLLDNRTAGFDIETYDPRLPLIIDPVISYATYLGGTGFSAVTGVAVDSGGNLYATGWTEALDFPIVGAEQAVNRGGVDVFIVKLNPTGSALLYATYVGGDAEDKAAGIALNGNLEALLTGSTASHNFPLVSAMQQTLGGSKTAFVLKLNAAGNTLLYSSYLGGTNFEVGTAIAVDGSGNAYVAGDTQSANFPNLAAAQPLLAGATDAFVAKFNSSGSLVFSTFLGGVADEHAGGIAVDPSGSAYIAGGTYSTNFPVVGAVQSANAGNQDAFVTKLSPSGAQILYSTYLGGSGLATAEQANAITVDASGNAYVTGVSNSANFPTTTGAYQTLFKGVSDAFVARLNAAGSALVFSTYLGGSELDWGNGIGLDGSGNVSVSGFTLSTDFPVVNGVQAAFGGFQDAFVAKINAAGNTLGFSTYYGGSGSDAANALAVDASGNMFVGGQSTSLNLPLTGAIQSSNNGGLSGWLARWGVTPPPLQFPSVVSVTPSSGSGNAPLFIAKYADTAGAVALTNVSLLVGVSASTGYGCYVSYNRAANVFTLANDDPSTGSQTVVPGGGTAQNDQCTLTGANSSASVLGTTLTLNLALAFVPSFAGLKTVYQYAADAGANTGWVAAGTWTVVIPPSQPSADTVSPNASSGAQQTFTFVFSDSQNASNLTGMAILFSSTLSVTNACSLLVDRNAGTVALLWDSALGSDPRPIGSATGLQNSQCKVGIGSITVSGLSQILSFDITFKGGFGGLRNIYLFGASGSVTTGYVQRGTYMVTAGGSPQAASVLPSSGSGPSQRFSFTVTDSGGASFLTGMAALFSTSLSAVNACSLVYDRTANTVSLAYDNPLNGATPVLAGSASVASNSQCTLRAVNTALVIGTTSIVLTMDLSFNAAWFGAKNIYLLAAEKGVNSGLVAVGTWTVTGGAPTADSVSPSSGTGAAPTLTFTVSDSSTQSNISGISMLITNGAPSVLANACYLVYNRITATIGLYDDTATGLSTKPIGSSAALFNTQCAVGYTVMTTSGTSVIFNINLLFRAFNGAKSVYLQAVEPNSNSGWVQRGAWTVP